MAIDEAWVDAQLATVHTSGPKRGGSGADAEQPSPFEGLSAERLSALGVSEAWAGLSAAQLAEMERPQRRRDIAGRLGVDVRFLPEGLEDDY